MTFRWIVTLSVPSGNATNSPDIFDLGVAGGPTLLHTTFNNQDPATAQFRQATDSFGYLASDGNGGTNTGTVTVTINAVNDPPTLDAISALTISENAPAQTVTLTGITSGATNENQVLTVRATSGNPALIPNPTVNYSSPNSTGSLTFTPKANTNGTALITVEVSDGGSQNATNTRTFSVTVRNLLALTPSRAGLTNGQFQFQLQATPGRSYVTEMSTNFVTWIPLTTNTPAGSVIDIKDTNAMQFRLRFYRVREGQ
jgi:hypothetical protein